MTSNQPSSLVLGTVQLGIPYGIANNTGQPDQTVVNIIIQTAWENGIREFDTAQDYGISEQALGVAFSNLGISKEARVISKIDPLLNHCDPSVMRTAIETSLEKLKVSCLWGMMLHKEELLSYWFCGLRDILESFISLGKVKKLGVSVYSPEKAIEAIHMEGIDMIQIPSNILDRRFEKQGVFELAVKNKKQVYIRSAFLQGLILMEPDTVPEYMSFARPVINQVKALSHELNLTRQELALGYLKARMPDAKILIGVETPRQVLENVASMEKNLPESILSLVPTVFDHVEEKLLNPSLWR